MRLESAAAAKSGFGPTRLVPREGTRLRRMYDLLQANKGLPIDIYLACFEGVKPGVAGANIEQLQDFYGLDIRKIKYGRWVLAGEWFGKVYVDYIADRLREADRDGAA